MRIRVLAFATASEALGGDAVELVLPEGAGLSTLRSELLRRFPGLEPLWPRLAIAVDGRVGGTELRDGVEVALLPPVSGGAPEVLVEGELDLAEILSRVADPRCGARVLFLGEVRDHHAGRRVDGITYSAYHSMAERTLLRIARELESDDPLVRVAIVHRVGELRVGEASTAIAVSAPHRDAAYDTSRLALERLKREVPIWKREHYRDGGSVWREVEPLSL